MVSNTALSTVEPVLTMVASCPPALVVPNTAASTVEPVMAVSSPPALSMGTSSPVDATPPSNEPATGMTRSSHNQTLTAAGALLEAECQQKQKKQSENVKITTKVPQGSKKWRK